MGTHISRVKSVDLDSWTDEQMKSIISWGNARANKYWEAKLAPGHVPSESKIENFIRTKYELKRWAMDGPIPDPSTLDVDGADEVPLGAAKSQSARKPSAGSSSSAPRTAAPVIDLIGGVDSAPPRASTTGPPAGRVPAKAEPAPPKATPSNSSLLGLDFLGESSAPPRPASTSGSSTPGGQSRPDLKQSILSLYASAPKPQPQQTQHQHQGSFGGMSSPTLGHQQQQGSIGGFNDAFGGLSLNKTSSPPPPADPFASLGSSSRSPPPPKPASNNSFGGLSGGSFFDSNPAQFSPPPVHQKKPSDGGFGDWGAFASPASAAPPKPAQPTTASHTSDLFDLASPPSQTTTSPPPPVMSPPASSSSVFNLSSPQTNSAPQQSPPKTTAAPAFATSGISGADVWGGNAWAAPGPAAPVAPAAPAALPAPSNPPAATSSSNDFGWGASGGSFASTPIVPGSGGGFNPQPKVSADEEFGGWASSTGPSNNNKPASKPAGGFGGADEDLFSNVWG